MSRVTHILSTSVCHFSGATYRQLDHWTSRGYVRPSVNPAVGSGRTRVYGSSDLVKVTAMVRLVGLGVSPAAASEALDGHWLKRECVYNHDESVSIVVDVEAIRAEVGEWIIGRDRISARNEAAMSS